MDMQQLRTWLDEHRYIALDVLRIYLGIGLFVRGVLFTSQPEAIMELLGPAGDSWIASNVILHYVALAHLGGGVLLTLGLLTRLAALVQLPALIGAVFLVHVHGGLLTQGQSLEFSVLVLVLLVIFFIFGAGRWSLDYYVATTTADKPQTALSKRAAAILDSARSAAQQRAQQTAPAEAAPAATGPATCRCGHTKDHHRVSAHARYGFWATLRLLGGTTGQPKEIYFQCDHCGEIIERTRQPEVLTYYRYHVD